MGRSLRTEQEALYATNHTIVVEKVPYLKIAGVIKEILNESGSIS